MTWDPTARAEVMAAIKTAERLGSRDGGKVRHDPNIYSLFVRAEPLGPGYGCEIQANVATGMVYFYAPRAGGSILLHEERDSGLAAWVADRSRDIVHGVRPTLDSARR